MSFDELYELAEGLAIENGTDLEYELSLIPEYKEDLKEYENSLEKAKEKGLVKIDKATDLPVATTSALKKIKKESVRKRSFRKDKRGYVSLTGFFKQFRGKRKSKTKKYLDELGVFETEKPSRWRKLGAGLVAGLFVGGVATIAVDHCTGHAAAEEPSYIPEKILEEDGDISSIHISPTGKELVYVKGIGDPKQELIKLNLETKQKTIIDRGGRTGNYANYLYDEINFAVFDNSGNVIYDKYHYERSGETFSKITESYSEIKKYSTSGKIETLECIEGYEKNFYDSSGYEKIRFLDSKGGNIFYQLFVGDYSALPDTVLIYYLKESGSSIMVKQDNDYSSSKSKKLLSVNNGGTKLAYIAPDDTIKIIKQSGVVVNSLRLDDVIDAKFGYGKLAVAHSTDLSVFSEDGNEKKDLGRMGGKIKLGWKDSDEFSFIKSSDEAKTFGIYLKRISENSQFTVVTGKSNLDIYGMYDHEWFGNKLYYTNFNTLYSIDSVDFPKSSTINNSPPYLPILSTIFAISTAAGLAYYLHKRKSKRKQQLPPPLTHYQQSAQQPQYYSQYPQQQIPFTQAQPISPQQPDQPAYYQQPTIPQTYQPQFQYQSQQYQQPQQLAEQQPQAYQPQQQPAQDYQNNGFSKVTLTRKN